MKKITLITAAIIAYCMLHTANCFSQGTAINSTGAAADNSAGLDVNFTDKGMLIPRMSTAERNAITSPANGLMIWNTSSNCLDFYVVSSWQSLACGCSAAPDMPGAISGSTSACAGSGENVYSINTVPTATSYTWTVPSGATINSGQGTISISVTYGSSSGDISVVASNNCGSGPQSTLAIIITTSPEAPVANAASNKSCSGFTANWSASTGATGYSLDVSTDAGYSTYLTGYNNLNVGTSLSYNITGLTSNTTYYYRVRASNSCGTGANSNSITTTIYIPYLEITLTNNQTTATPANFQQMLTVNSSTYSSYESSGLENIEFSTGPGGTGTVLQAWIESGASNAATSTVYWINLASNTIAGSGGTLTVYMNFMPNSVMSASGPTGKAPQLSVTYGEDDNGVYVFSNYWNFAGSGLPTGWVSSNQLYSVSNGLTVNNAPAASPGYLGYNTSISLPKVMDSYVTSWHSGTSGSSWSMTFLGAGGNFSNPFGSDYGSLTLPNSASSANGWQYFYSGSPVVAVASPPSGIISQSFTTSTSALYYNYSFVNSNANNLSSSVVVGMQRQNGAPPGTWSFQYIRMRNYPPSDVMPETSVNSISCE